MSLWTTYLINRQLLNVFISEKCFVPFIDWGEGVGLDTTTSSFQKGKVITIFPTYFCFARRLSRCLPANFLQNPDN